MKIEINGLTKKFGEISLFEELNLEIKDKKITCLYGSSGCGKTTILNIIGLIEPYDKGRVFYDGREVIKKNEKRNFLRNDVGFIFQDFGLLENETVLQNMKLVYKIRKSKDPADRIDKVLQQLQLENMLYRKVYELSGGEQQRIAIAKLILKDPQLVLADEPTASLDEENKKIVLTMIKKLRDLGKTIIIVSHDDEVREFADHSIDLNERRKA